MANGVRFGVLGRLEVVVGRERVEVGGRKQRELLGMLLLNLNKVVPAGQLVEALWGEQPPASADVTLRTHVSHLRQRLAGGAAALITERPGYGLMVDLECVDSARFEGLVEQARQEKPERAAELLRAALGEWRGPVLADLGEPLFAQAETARLEALRLAAWEDRIEADLALGRHRELIGELDALVAEHPFRERFAGQLMLAHYRSGGQVEALAVYTATRQRLMDELGLEPGPELAELETAMLRQDPRLRLNKVTAPPDALFAVVRRVKMVGRDGELAKLRELLQAGGRRVVAISGEAGVGKTRLVAEFAHETTNATFLVGRCDELVPYQAVAAALKSSAEAANVPKEIRARLAPLFGSERDATGEQTALFEAIEWLVKHLPGPVVFVVEDAERIDRASSLLLKHLARQVQALFVICFRDPPGTRHGPLRELLGELKSLADRIVLQPLTEPDLTTLVEAITGEPADAEFVHELKRNTGGNPFFASEVVRDYETGQVPSGVRDVLRHRLHALAEPAKQVVRCAAVLGREVEFDLLAQLADQSEDSVIDSLDRAVAAGFLVEAGKSWKASYAFPHGLMRDAVYTDIPAPRRQRLHLRAAQALESRGLTNDVSAAAVHLREAGPTADPRRTAELSLRAAEEAERVYAWDEAVVHTEVAVEILDHIGAPPAQQADAAVRAARLRLKASIGFPLVVKHLETAVERYRAAGDNAALGSVHIRLGAALSVQHSIMDIPRAIEHFAAAERLLDDPGTTFHLHSGLSQAAMYGLRTDLLGQASQRASELSAELGRRDLAVLAGWGQAWYRFNRGELAEADAVLETMWATARELGDAYLGWASVNAAALCATEYQLNPAKGLMWSRRGLAQSRFDTFAYARHAVIDQLVLATAAMGNLAEARRTAEELPEDAVSKRLLTFLDGHWEQAERAWVAALEADEATGDLHDAAVNARWLAEARTALGREEEAAIVLRRALAYGADGRQVATELMARAALARIEKSAEHVARCDEILASGEDWAGQAGTVEVARAAVAAAQGKQAESDAAHERAIEIFAAHELPWRRADAMKAWAYALDSAGRREDAEVQRRAARDVHVDIGAARVWLG